MACRVSTSRAPDPSGETVFVSILRLALSAQFSLRSLFSAVLWEPLRRWLAAEDLLRLHVAPQVVAPEGAYLSVDLRNALPPSELTFSPTELDLALAGALGAGPWSGCLTVQYPPAPPDELVFSSAGEQPDAELMHVDPLVATHGGSPRTGVGGGALDGGRITTPRRSGGTSGGHFWWRTRRGARAAQIVTATWRRADIDSTGTRCSCSEEVGTFAPTDAGLVCLDGTGERGFACESTLR